MNFVQQERKADKDIVSNVTIKQGNILNADEQYLLHQCNCYTKNSKGLATKIFTQFPYSNTYVNRRADSEFGGMDICGNGRDQRYVINLYSQYHPGKPKSRSGFDSYSDRLNAFKKGLVEIFNIDNIESIAMPFNIGCGLAGGQWPDYFEVINNIPNERNIRIVLYKFE